MQNVKNNLCVVKKRSEDSYCTDKKAIEDIVSKHEIAMKNSYQNKSGDLVLVCESTDDSSRLQSLAKDADANISIYVPSPKMKTVSVVGLVREYSSEEFAKLLRAQNYAIKLLAESTKFEDHFKFRSSKCLKNDPSKFQVFCSVSEDLLTIFQKCDNKVMIGLNVCKVYLQNNVLRCFNCQEHGHIAKFCKNSVNCGKCALPNATKDCTSDVQKCINCEKSGTSSDTSHYSFHYNCPTLISALKKLSERNSNLN